MKENGNYGKDILFAAEDAGETCTVKIYFKGAKNENSPSTFNASIVFIKGSCLYVVKEVDGHDVNHVFPLSGIQEFIF